MPKLKIELEITDAILLREAVLLLGSQSTGGTRTECMRVLEKFDQKIKEALDAKL